VEEKSWDTQGNASHRRETFGLSTALKLLIGWIYDEYDMKNQAMEGNEAALAAWTETSCSIGGY
jgi:hypothetical protein